MAAEVIMPALGMAQETGRLLRWIRQEGEAVSRGDPLMEIETDKATVEMEAQASGVLGGVMIQPGEEVQVGAVMAWILSPGEAVPPSPAPRPPAPPASLPVAPTEAAQFSSAPGGPSRRLAASPLARRIARERGVELLPGQGSGPEGAYVASDLPGAGPALPGVGATAESGSARRRMALHTTRVWTSTPHFYLGRDVRARRLREELESLRRATSEAITYTDLLLRSAGQALRSHPRLLEYWAGEGVSAHSEVAVGLAIDAERGLMLASIPDPDRLSVADLARTRRQAVERAQQGRLAGSDLAPACLTLSNLGMFGVDRFQAVLSEGQSSILAVGRIVDQVVVTDGRPSVEPVMSLNLSCDHRVLDGATAAPFLNTLVELLENFPRGVR
ncbi:MAG: dihydrolipoamide acetyltransferase family protein [Candidatus Dormibacteria bacterium]